MSTQSRAFAVLLAACTALPGVAPAQSASDIRISTEAPYDKRVGDSRSKMRVWVENRSGRKLRTVQVTCTAYDRSGRSIKTAYASVTDIRAGGRLGTDAYYPVPSAAIARTKCSVGTVRA